MKYQATDSIGSLFDDDPELEYSESTSIQVPTRVLKGVRSLLWIACLAVGLIFCGYLLWPTTLSIAQKPTRLTVVGTPVGRLQTDTVVSLAGVEVGRVIRLSLDEKVPAAEIRLDAAIASKLTSDSQFEIKPQYGNSVGNIGIAITNGRLQGTKLPTLVQIRGESSIVEQSLEDFQDFLKDPDELVVCSPIASPSLLTSLGAIASLIAIVAAGLRLMRGTIKAIVMPALFALILAVLLFVIAKVQAPDLIPNVLEWTKSTVQNPHPQPLSPKRGEGSEGIER